MRTMIPSIVILVSLSGSTPAKGQLPSDIFSDSYLLRAAQRIPPDQARDGPREKVGVYGDWAVYALREGSVSVCYVESELLLSPKADRDLGDARIQVTSRALNEASAMVRFTADIMSKSGLTMSIGSGQAYDLYMLHETFERSHRWRARKLVKEMKEGEAKNIDIEIRREKDGTLMGTYSLKGFNQAYSESIRAYEDKKRRYGDYFDELVTATEILLVKEPSVHTEFSFTGPFLDSSHRTITIKSFPEGYEALFSVNSYIEPPNPNGFFYVGSQRMEFYNEGKLIGTSEGGYRTSLTGLCFEPESERIRLVLNIWDGGASIPASDRIRYYDPDAGIVGGSLSSVEGAASVFDCSDGGSSWGDDKGFMPCLCAGKAAENEYQSRLSDFSLRLSRLKSESAPEGVSLEEILGDAEFLNPWVKWDFYSDLEVERFESSKFEVMVFTLYDKGDVYGNEQVTFIRRLPDDYFVPVYMAQTSSKSFQTVEIHGFVDEEVLDLTMCVRNCNRRGYHERLKKNAGEWWEEGRKRKTD